MSEQRLVKVVYGYDIERDKIAARHYYETDSVHEHSEVIYHTREEWENLLYDIRNANQPVEVKTVVEEYLES